MPHSLTWQGHQFFGALFICVLMAFAAAPRIGALFALTWLWVMASAAWVAFSPWYEAPYLPPAYPVRTVWGASQALFLAVSLPACVMYMKERHILMIIGFWAVAELILRGFCDTGTVNGNTFASSLFFLASLTPGVAAIPGVLSAAGAFWFAGSTTVTMAIAYTIGYVKWRETWSCIFGVSIIAAVLGAILLRDGDSALSSNSRAEVWLSAITFWSDRVPWYGTGIGTWEWIGAYLVNDVHQIFLWAHNDFLQMLFEGGVIGFWLLIATILKSLWCLRRNRYWFAIGLAYTACMVTYYPMHFTISQVMGLLILRKSLEQR